MPKKYNINKLKQNFEQLIFKNSSKFLNNSKLTKIQRATRALFEIMQKLHVKINGQNDQKWLK